MHFAKAHPGHKKSTPEPTTSPEEGFSCMYCSQVLPSHRSRGQHIRNQHAAEASRDRAREAALQVPREWAPSEHALFVDALERHGPSSNTVLAEAVGTKSAKQVGVHKRIFLRDNPNWIAHHPPPPTRPATRRRLPETPKKAPHPPSPPPGPLPAPRPGRRPRTTRGATPARADRQEAAPPTPDAGDSHAAREAPPTPDPPGLSDPDDPPLPPSSRQTTPPSQRDLFSPEPGSTAPPPPPLPLSPPQGSPPSRRVVATRTKQQREPATRTAPRRKLTTAAARLLAGRDSSSGDDEENTRPTTNPVPQEDHRRDAEDASDSSKGSPTSPPPPPHLEDAMTATQRELIAKADTALAGLRIHPLTPPEPLDGRTSCSPPGSWSPPTMSDLSSPTPPVENTAAEALAESSSERPEEEPTTQQKIFMRTEAVLAKLARHPTLLEEEHEERYPVRVRTTMGPTTLPPNSQFAPPPPTVATPSHQLPLSEIHGCIQDLCRRNQKEELIWLEAYLADEARDRSLDEEWEELQVRAMGAALSGSMASAPFQRLFTLLNLHPPPENGDPYWRIPARMSPRELADAANAIRLGVAPLPHEMQSTPPATAPDRAQPPSHLDRSDASPPAAPPGSPPRHTYLANLEEVTPTEPICQCQQRARESPAEALQQG